MNGQKQLHRSLTAAHSTLDSALDRGLEQYLSNLKWNHQDAVCLAIEQFAEALAEIPGGREELERRATLIEHSTSPGSDYHAARTAALRSISKSRRKAHQPLQHLRESTDVLYWLVEVNRQQPYIKDVLEIQNLSQRARAAFQHWHNLCRRIKSLAEMQFVDGCWWLLRVYQAAEDSAPEHIVAQQVLLKTNAGGVWLADIKAAANSLVDWATEVRTAVCPTCGKAIILDEHNRPQCSNCGGHAGRLSELLIYLQTGEWPAHAETETLAELRYLVRSRWGEWNRDTVQQLQDWLIVKHCLTREQSLVIELQQVIELLRSDVSITEALQSAGKTSSIVTANGSKGGAQPHSRTKGRKQPPDEVLEAEAELVKEWIRAREVGISRTEFARDRSMKLEEFKAIVDRVRKRKPKVRK